MPFRKMPSVYWLFFQGIHKTGEIDFGGVVGGCRADKIAFGFIEVDERGGLLGVDVKAVEGGFAGIVRPLIEFRSATVADAFLLGRHGDDVENGAAGLVAAHAAGGQAGDQHFVVGLNENDGGHAMVRALQDAFEGFRLRNGTGESVQKAAIGDDVLFLQSVFNHFGDDVVRNEATGRDDAFDLVAEVSSCGHLLTEDVACRNMDGFGFFAEHFAYGAFAGSRRADENIDVSHGYAFFLLL